MEKKIVDIFDISYEGSGVGKLDGQIEKEAFAHMFEAQFSNEKNILMKK